MPTFMSDGLEIAYAQYDQESGSGRPILLVHGFASNGRVNWVATGWVQYLIDAGFAPITIDNRGHGASEKVYDPALYPAREMAKDSRNLIQHLGLGPIPVMGYSMGARISTYLALDNPELVQAVVIGGLGERMLSGMSNAQDIVEALLAPSLDDVKTETGRMFRRFSEKTRSDLKALAACMSSGREPIVRAQLQEMQVPALVAVGDLDEVGGAAEPLARILPQGQALVIEGRDHMNATGDKQFKAGVVEFLNNLPN